MINTQMSEEAREFPVRLAEQRTHNAGVLAEVAGALRDLDPPFIATCARGSSDHAATYLKYLFERRLGLPTLSFAPSVASVYESRLRLDGAAFVAISQSGASPDIVRAAQAAREAGALVIAVINAAESPLARVADHVIPLHVGSERSVAATKSCVGSMTAVYDLCASWRGDRAMQEALAALPEALEQAESVDWSAAEPVLAEARQAFVIARGQGLAAAQEAALKLKETCRIQAEAFSAAEVRHGPMAIVGPGFPLIAAATGDASDRSVAEVADHFARLGASVLFAGPGPVGNGAIHLPTPSAPAPDLQPIVFLQCVYHFVNRLSLARGLDPDNPAGLRKVTETV